MLEIAKEFGDSEVFTIADMFNEFVDYFKPYNLRTNGWNARLSIEDLCDIASNVKKELPGVDFGYNDWNFENPEKRKRIFEVIERIQEYEREHGLVKDEEKIMTHIGMQFHTSTEASLEEIEKAIDEAARFGLPIDITELDIAREIDGFNYENATEEELAAARKLEIKKQNEIMKLLSRLVREGKVRGITAWSLTDDLCCDICDGKYGSITGYDGKNYFGKDMDEEIILTPEEEQLINENIEREAKRREEELKSRRPLQDYCYHVHTERCGHAAKDTSDERYIQEAISGGIKKIAFTDHTPLPIGKSVRPNSRMDIAEFESYLSSIKYFKERYRDKIEIESGVEFEYSDRDLDFMQDIRSEVDKMILGQHFVIKEDGEEVGIARKNRKTNF